MIMNNTVESFVIEHLISETDAEILLYKLGRLIDSGFKPIDFIRLFDDVERRKLSKRSAMFFTNVELIKGD